MRRSIIHPLTALVVLAVLAVARASGIVGAQASRTAPTFFDDDPLSMIVDTQDASKAQSRELSLVYDASINLIGRPGLRVVGRAESINTIDEVPDSAWFTNRKALVPDEIRRGVTDDAGPAPGQWTVSRKSNGVSPGFTITDQRGRRYFVKFDPPGLPELATGAEAVVTRLFHALGYYVPQVNIGTLRPENLVIGPDATVRMPDGSRRRMRHTDIEEQLSRADRQVDGTYRVSLAAALEGRPLEGFKYEGTRSDDPNDIVPHENRRELRGLRVFSAWLNHTDAKAINSMDTLLPVDGRSIVRHNLIDFNAALGSAGIGLRERRDGYEYLAEVGAAGKALPAFGFKPRAWMRIEYPNFRGIGRFESKAFEPEQWRPRVPNPAYVRSRADDTFWAARKLMGLPDAVIRAAVQAGQYTDPGAERFLGDALIERRDKIGRVWLTGVNPVIDPALSAAGALTFRNAAVDYEVATGPGSYLVKWYRFDNGTGDSEEIGTTTGQPPFRAPADLRGSFVRVDISAVDGGNPSWNRPVRAHLRRIGGGWQLVGFDRMPDAPPMRAGLVGAELK